MNTKRQTVFLISLLLAMIILSSDFGAGVKAEATPDVYVGVHLGYGDVAEAKSLINRVSGFTNFVLIGTSKIFYNAAKLNETFQYAFDHGMSFMSFTPSLPPESWNPSIVNRTAWFNYANLTWGNRLVGFYQEDEPGGKALDKNPPTIINIGGGNETFPGNITVTDPSNCVEAANAFVDRLNDTLSSVRNYRLNQTDYPLFTADYGLYWFDYKAGYDGLFAEFVANYSRQMTVALVRGAATVQNKEWGVLIGWKYDVPPYLASGEDLYNDMVYAYDAGAKYILVFDANEGWTGDILQEEHLQAMQRFWAYVQNNPRRSYSVSERKALLLPDAYATGFRWPGDKIWGIWPQNETSEIINVAIGGLLEAYGDRVDIIYDDALGLGNNYGYGQLLYWDDPTLQPTPTPSPTPTPTPTPSPTPTLSPTPTPSPSPTQPPSQSPSPTPSPSPTQQATSSPDPNGWNLPMNYVYAAAAGTTVAGAIGVTVVLRKKRLSSVRT